MNFNPATSDLQTRAYAQKIVDATDHFDAIMASYEASFKNFTTIAEDPYLGIDEFGEARDTCNEIYDELMKLKDASKDSCCAQIPLYCNLYALGKGINGLVDTCMDGVDDLTSSEGVELFNTYAGLLNALHGLPYVVVICMLFYTALWYKNGNWCCASNGKFLDFACIILPQILFWLVSVVIMAIFTVLGWGISVLFNVYEIKSMPGNPTFQDLIDHIAETYPYFWGLVVGDLLSGLEFFRYAVTILFLVSFWILFHSCCFCCCKPYKSEDTKAEG